MQHYVFLGENRSVLGVWVARDARDAVRLQLELSLTYPDCETLVRPARDYESLKAGHQDYDFAGLEPSPSALH